MFCICFQTFDFFYFVVESCHPYLNNEGKIVKIMFLDRVRFSDFQMKEECDIIDKSSQCIRVFVVLNIKRKKT